MKLGIDIGSTTIKAVLLSDDNEIVWSTYERHMSRVSQKTVEVLSDFARLHPGLATIRTAVTGSAGLGVASAAGMAFVQEVYADSLSCAVLTPGADVILELGGEDAKVLFMSGLRDAKMNGSCAGGTGAFIDQMAALMKVTPEELDMLAKRKDKVYAIASRCGVFAKSDIQPLLNQGAKKEDVAASILYSVVNQTITGLAQGRRIEGNVVYLGGPLTFMGALRDAFDDVLGLKGTLPENSLYFAAMGAALYATQETDLTAACLRLEESSKVSSYAGEEPLFTSREDYEAFCARHSMSRAQRLDMHGYSGFAHLGVDSGSTTVKTVLLDTGGRIISSTYRPNDGDPVQLVKEAMMACYDANPGMILASVTTTGYGEALIKEAVNADHSLVETMAHMKAAQAFDPECDFVIDIGGQDMKCFRIQDDAVGDIFLNEACSSGCGSFLQTFCEALGITTDEFSRMALFAEKPVMLGSRCTVFMNSSVKQAQRDGATVGDISAGLAVSVVKNALYKVIRVSDAASLGKRIIVQGGAFHSDAVLRAFERELGCDVIRPDIAALMGAYGAALHGMSLWDGKSPSLAASREETPKLFHNTSAVACGLCENRCTLTINRFSGKRKLVSGNRCEKPTTRLSGQEELNLMEYKRGELARYNACEGSRGVIGLPLALNFFETLPFWFTFFSELGFGVRVSPPSTRKTFYKGQADVQSDTVCYPAKLVHGHIRQLAAMKEVDAIFYPCMTYNIDEGLGTNHYNCPVVAYYPESVAVSYSSERPVIISPYLGIHMPKTMPGRLREALEPVFPGLRPRDVRHAVKKAYAEYEAYLARVRDKGAELAARARAENRRIVLLCGRPYHLDGEVNHGIDRLIAASGAAVLTEDAVSTLSPHTSYGVLNQWTYHARLYAAARYAAAGGAELVQLVSFGCGLDAITSDEVREILSASGKLYTQLKIDEIVNLGAVGIRIRSLFAALDSRDLKSGKGGAA